MASTPATPSGICLSFCVTPKATVATPHPTATISVTPSLNPATPAYTGDSPWGTIALVVIILIAFAVWGNIMVRKGGDG